MFTLIVTDGTTVCGYTAKEFDYNPTTGVLWLYTDSPDRMDTSSRMKQANQIDVFQNGKHLGSISKEAPDE